MMIRPNCSNFMFAVLLASSCSMIFSMEPVERGNIVRAIAQRECSVCFDEEPEVVFSPLVCGHYQGSRCNECRLIMLFNALKKNTVAEMNDVLRCIHSDPNPGNLEEPIRCPHIMNEVDIRAIAGNEVAVAQYSDKLFDLMLNTDPLIRRCPTRDCRDGYSLPQPTPLSSVYNFLFGMSAVQCKSCNQEYCPDCRMPHSRFALCMPFAHNRLNKNSVNNNNNNAPAANDVDDNEVERQIQDLKDWMKQNDAKLCLHCHGIIVKNDGCIHMTHREEHGGCGYEFCWECLLPWREHDTSWPYTCRPKDLATVGTRIALMNEHLRAAHFIMSSQWGRHIRDRRVVLLWSSFPLQGA